MNFIRKLGRPLAAAVIIILAPCSANAHSAPKKPMAAHGGIVAQTEQFNLEIVATDGMLKLYVRDRHNRVADSRDYAGSALVWGSDSIVALELKPGSEAGLLQAAGDFTVAAIRRVIVTVAAPGDEPAKAWFTGFGSSTH